MLNFAHLGNNETERSRRDFRVTGSRWRKDRRSDLSRRRSRLSDKAEIRVLGIELALRNQRVEIETGPSGEPSASLASASVLNTIWPTSRFPGCQSAVP